MIGKTNASLGGGGGEVFALIQQPYPVGSTCTCSKGDIVLTAKDTSGLAIFAVTEAGTWTITTTNGTQTKTTTVEITTKGETVIAPTLVYEKVLYDAGDECTAASGGWTVYCWGVSSAEKLDDCIYLYNKDGQQAEAYTKKAVNMADYTTLNVQCSDGWKTNSGYFYIGVADGTAEMSTSSLGAKTYTLDVSTITNGVVYLRPYGYWSDDANQLSECGVYITKVWLS